MILKFTKTKHTNLNFSANPCKNLGTIDSNFKSIESQAPFCNCLINRISPDKYDRIK